MSTFYKGKVTASETLTGKLLLVPWILDTGASNHMTGPLDILTEVIDIEPCLVGLPDGRHSIATKRGTLILGQFINLLHVLFVEGLNCHVVSVSQLVRQSKCFAHFGPGLCAIQDRSRMLIGAGEESDGLYYFREVKAVGAVSLHVNVTIDMWHQ